MLMCWVEAPKYELGPTVSRCEENRVYPRFRKISWLIICPTFDQPSIRFVGGGNGIIIIGNCDPAEGETMTAMSDQIIWIFTGNGGSLPSGVFLDLASAEQRINERNLSGLLTGYPVNQCVYEWAIEKGFFRPSKSYQKSSEFIARFTSASQPHYHYENGQRVPDLGDQSTPTRVVEEAVALPSAS